MASETTTALPYEKGSTVQKVRNAGVLIMAGVKVVLPGDTVDVDPAASIGPGVYEPEGNAAPVTCRAGMLRGDPNDRVWVDFDSKRYVPVEDERVLGVVTKTTGKVIRVDIGSAVSAVLPELAFEGATKRNRPTLQVGELVYARVSRAHKDTEPELSCVDQSGKANGLGPLPVLGYAFKCSIGLCRKLLSVPRCPVLQYLGEHYKFEVTVGLNGLVWVDSPSLSQTILIVNAIQNSQYMSEIQCREMVKKLAEMKYA